MEGVVHVEEVASRREWQSLLATAGRSGLQQGWSYGEALRAGGVPVHRLVARDGQGRAVALAQLAERRWLGFLGLGFLLRGPVWLAPAAREAREGALLAAARRRLGRGGLVWAPELPGPSRRLHGRRPVVTGYATAWLELDGDLGHLRQGLDGKWRNALRQAERHRIEPRECEGGELARWLLDANEVYRRRVDYRGPGRAFLGRLVEAAARDKELLLLVAREGSTPVAGVAFVRHGAAASYEVGHATPRGRELRAGHLLLWRAFERLTARGVRWVDLGGVDTDRAPGIARFKLGTGATAATLAGTFFIPPFAG